MFGQPLRNLRDQRKQKRKKTGLLPALRAYAHGPCSFLKTFTTSRGFAGAIIMFMPTALFPYE